MAPDVIEQGTEFPIHIPQGATWRKHWAWAEDDDAETPVSIADYEPQGQVRAHKDRDSALLAEMLFDVLEDGEDFVGEFVSRIGATATGELERDGWYSIELHHKSDPDEVVLFAQGPAYRDSEVTQ